MCIYKYIYISISVCVCVYSNFENMRSLILVFLLIHFYQKISQVMYAKLNSDLSNIFIICTAIV